MTDADPRLNQAVIPPSVLTGVVEIGQREARPITSWFDGTGLDPVEIFTSGTLKVSFRQAATVLRRAVRAMPGQPLGMQTGARDVLLTFGLLGVAMRSCATAGDAFALGVQMHQASGSLLDLETETLGDQIAMRLHERRPDPELLPFLCEEVLCSTITLARSVHGADWAPTAVELTYSEPVYARQYRRFFRCPITYGADANRMIFPATLLDQAMPTGHEPTRAAAVEACRRLLDLDGTHPDVVVAVETLLSRNLRHPVTMTEVADHLHVTERTLRRQLAATGESFSTVRDRIRERRATFLLNGSTLPINAIAKEIGFSEAREFRRAYLRWTGLPPSKVRRK